MGALVTLQLPPGSAVRELPWIITFGPLTDSEDWEPVVCGPYEHVHALALAEEVVADEELMAVVEPMMGFASPEEIRTEITVARAAAIRDAAGEDDGVYDDDFHADDDGFHAGDLDDPAGDDGDRYGHTEMPSPEEIRAGMMRVARRLAEPS